MMGRQDTTIQINPDVLRWAIVGSGWEVGELSKNTNISSEAIQKWKRSSAAIKVSDLRKIFPYFIHLIIGPG